MARQKSKIPKEWIGNSSHFSWCGDVPLICFGKYRGRDIGSVARSDSEYMTWLSKNLDLPPHVSLIATQALALEPHPFKKWLKESFWKCK